jgi:carbon storage regulator CsrA
MLILSRKRQESIQIGPDIVLKVLGLSASAVLVGIDAPPSVLVLRGELTPHTPDGQPPPAAIAAALVEQGEAHAAPSPGI